MKYSNYLASDINVFKMLTGFVEAWMALNRNNYVYYYNSGFYSHITGNYALNFEPSMIDIKDRAKEKDYQIYSYSVIFEDEKQISNKVSTNFQQVFTILQPVKNSAEPLKSSVCLPHRFYTLQSEK